MMTALSSAAWVVHDVGLAAAIGGPIFEYTAMAPALQNANDGAERDRISVEAAQRFSLVKLISHASFALPWIVGRTLRSGREVSAQARVMTIAKDVLVGVSLVSGVIGLLGLRRVSKRVEERGAVPMGAMEEEQRIPTKTGAVGVLGIVNIAANIGILGLTAMLAMQGSKSRRFSVSSRCLP